MKTHKQTQNRSDDVPPLASDGDIFVDDIGEDYTEPEPEQKTDDVPGFRKVPVFGEEGSGKTLWHVCVEHSPFILKQANVWGSGRAEAKKLFLTAVRAEHEAKAAKERGLGDKGDRHASKLVMDSFHDGLKRQREFRWLIKDWAAVKAWREDYHQRLSENMRLSAKRQRAQLASA